MKRNILIAIAVCGFVLGIGLIGIGKCADGFVPAIPPMPLLEKWMGTSGKDKMPITQQQTTCLFRDRLAGIDWHAAEVSSFEANIAEDAITANIGYSVYNDAYRKLFLLIGNEQFPNEVSVKDLGWPHVLDTNDLSAAVFVKAGADLILKPGVIYQLKKNGKTIDYQQIDRDDIPVDTQSVRLTRDPNTNRRVLVDRINGNIIAIAPEKGHYYKGASTDNTITLVGIDETMNANNVDTIVTWAISSKDKSQWQVVTRSIDYKYLASLLSPIFIDATPVPINTDNEWIALCKDGSAVLRVEWKTYAEHDRISCKCLIKQPQVGKPQLLAWEVYHSYASNPSRDNEQIITNNDLAASRTFNHIWYVDNKEIVSSYLYSRWETELLFSIDMSSDKVVFLRNGYLWGTSLK